MSTPRGRYITTRAPVDEIARELGCSIATVNKDIRSGLDKLRAALERRRLAFDDLLPRQPGADEADYLEPIE